MFIHAFDMDWNFRRINAISPYNFFSSNKSIQPTNKYKESCITGLLFGVMNLPKPSGPVGHLFCLRGKCAKGMNAFVSVPPY